MNDELEKSRDQWARELLKNKTDHEVLCVHCHRLVHEDSALIKGDEVICKACSKLDAVRMDYLGLAIRLIKNQAGRGQWG